MKTLAPLALVFLSLPAAAFEEIAPDRMKPGLQVREYPRHVTQSEEKKFFLSTDQLGEPVGKPKTIKSLTPWSWNRERNAIASGFLVIEKEGDYAFTTDSFYDRNQLFIGGKLVCDYADGGSKVVTIPLKKGLVGISSVGFVGSRGSIQVRWRPPGQRELSEIPGKFLRHAVPAKKKKGTARSGPGTVADSLTVVAKDFVLDVYRNGKRVPDSQRELLLDRFGATAERVHVKVKEGDWLVFHVAHNRLRHQGTKYFAVAGQRGEDAFALISDPESLQWSSCDDPEQAAEFIRHRDYGTENRARSIERPWEEGLKFMNQYAGEGFPGAPLWGEGPSTWVKVVVEKPVPSEDLFVGGRVEWDLSQFADSAVAPDLKKPQPVSPSPAPEPEDDDSATEEPGEALAEVPPVLPIEQPKQWPVQILSAIYGTGGKNANVTERVKQLVEVEKTFFAANPGHLKADPNPYWNKSLHIVYMKDGVRREQHRNENEHILPESFYGPHDKSELAAWLEGTRWKGEAGELQFHASGAVTGSGVGGTADWEAFDKNWVRIIRSGEDKTAFVFDYTWSSFHEQGNGRNVFRRMK